MTLRRLFCIALLLAAAAANAATGMRAGLWEITARVQGEGASSAPAQTIRTCISQEDIARSKGRPPGAEQGLENCGVSDLQERGDGATWRFSCTGRPAMSGTASISYGNDSFNQETTMKTAGSDKVALTVTTQGRRVGDCTK